VSSPSFANAHSRVESCECRPPAQPLACTDTTNTARQRRRRIPPGTLRRQGSIGWACPAPISTLQAVDAAPQPPERKACQGARLLALQPAQASGGELLFDEHHRCPRDPRVSLPRRHTDSALKHHGSAATSLLICPECSHQRCMALVRRCCQGAARAGGSAGVWVVPGERARRPRRC
jgi:hypothetical protein